MQLSVIIANYNAKELLKDCLESVFKYTKGLDFEVIVVDNGSTDGSVEYLKTQNSKLKTTCPAGKRARQNLKLKTILNKENLGFAKANNQGIKIAEGKYILLLNSDTLLKDNVFSKMVDFMEKHPGVSAVGPRLLNADDSKQASVGRFPTLPVVIVMLFKEHFGGSRYVRCSPDETGEVDWVMGAALMARKKIFDRIGLLDEKIFMYNEEVEWCYRVKKEKGRIFYYPSAEIIHLWQGSSKTGKKDPILNIYKGLLYFYQKHKNPIELAVLRFLLKLKAGSAYLLGALTGNNYLKETYGQAIKIS